MLTFCATALGIGVVFTLVSAAADAADTAPAKPPAALPWSQIGVGAGPEAALANRVTLWLAPAGERLGEDYTLRVNGQELPVYSCRVSAVPRNQVWPRYQRPENQTDLGLDFATATIRRKCPSLPVAHPKPGGSLYRRGGELVRGSFSPVSLPWD